jgi:hypothetical protein
MYAAELGAVNSQSLVQCKILWRNNPLILAVDGRQKSAMGGGLRREGYLSSPLDLQL